MMNHQEKTFIRCRRQGGFALPFFVLLGIMGIFAACPAVQAATDVSGQVKVNYTNPFYNQTTKVQSYDVTLTNIGTAPIAAPLKVVIESLSSTQVTVANPDGTKDGKPYFDYSSLLGDGTLSPQEISQARKWQFNNPTRTRFTIQTRVLAGSDDTIPPTITINSPVDGSTINNPLPFILIQYSDSGSGIDLASLNVKLNGADISNQFTKTAQSAFFQPTTVLPQGQNVINASIRDLAGNTQTAQSTFTISYLLPIITITNPVDGGYISTATPFITILFKDDLSGIDPDSCVIEINGVDRTSLFTITETKAAALYDGQLPTGPNTITVTVSNDYGLDNSASSHFMVSSSAGINWYFFSLLGNSWIFTSPGDGTYNEYLRAEKLGVDDTDITSFDISGTGNHYFTQAGDNQILESLGDGYSNLYLTNAQIGLTDSEYVNALHLLSDGRVAFSIFGQQNIFVSPGDNTKGLLLTNTALGVPGQEITAFHQGYNGRYYFAVTGMDGILESTGDGSNTQVLTSADLGVEGSAIDAFSVVPDTRAPAIQITSPMDGAFLNTTRPTITVTFSDDYAGIDTNSFRTTINGVDYSGQCTVTATGATCQIASDLSVGANAVVASINDRAGNTGTATSHVQLGILRAIPSATPSTGRAPLAVHFISNGEDPAGTIVIFRWDFDGNGTWDTYDTVARDYDHTYNSPGTYNAKLFVQSSTGQTATATVVITVDNNPPTASADVLPSNGAVPLTVQLSGTGQDTDGSIVRYEWDFEGDGTYEWSSTTTGNTSYTYTRPGNFQAVFRVTDNSGATATAVAVTTVVNVGPEGTPTAQGNATPSTGPAPLTVNFSGTGTDPDGTIVLYEWDFDNDGIFDWSSNTSANVSHTYTAAGNSIAAFRVTDNNGNKAVDYLLIQVGLQVSLSVADADKTFNPYAGQTMSINASINAPVPASVLIKNTDGEVITSIPVDTTNIPILSFQDNMESGANGWTHGGSNDLWQIGTPTSGPGSAHSGNNVWGTNLSGNYLDYMNCWLLSPAIQITEPSQLTFYQYFYSESGYDYGYVEISTDGVNFSSLTSYNGGLGGWSKQEFDLSSYTGRTVQIRFRFHTDESVVYPGWYIDDVQISKGTGNVTWNGKDDANIPVPDGVYYATLRYQFEGAWHELDVTQTTGGNRFNPPRQTTGGTTGSPATARPFEDQFLPIYYTLNQAAEVTLFVGVLWNTDTRVRTIYNRVPISAGNQIAYWDGLDDNGNIAQAPPGNNLILGIWGYTLPANAMYLTGGRPAISNVAATPNYFSPFSEKCESNGNGEGILLSYNVSEAANTVELRAYSLATKALVRTATKANVPAGQNVLLWDVRNNNGEYLDKGDYQVGLVAKDSQGNESMLSYTLVRIDY